MRHALILLAFAAALSGCMTEDVLRHDGVTMTAGDAIAANTAMQIVDPWPRGVEDTRLATPAERPGPARPAASGDSYGNAEGATP